MAEQAQAPSTEGYRAPRLPLSLADFELVRRIGDGSYSHVVLGVHRSSGREYALKVLDKAHLVRHKVVDYVKRERLILDRLGALGGWVAELQFTFQDALSIYMVLEYCPNGELYDQIRLRGRLPEDVARVYTAEVVVLLGLLRAHGVVHRDLKPENLLLDGEGHLKVIDFGGAKLLQPPVVEQAAERAAGTPSRAAATAAAEDASAAAEAPAPAAGQPAAGANGAAEGRAGTVGGGASGGQEERPADENGGAVGGEAAGGGSGGDAEGGSASASASGRPEGAEAGVPASVKIDASGLRPAKRAVSLVGTADYVSPEVLNNTPVGHAADLWALGCVVYHMLTGRPPFKAASEYLTFQRIASGEYSLPEELSPAAADLVSALLRVEPRERLGAEDLGELRGHPFFEGVEWEGLRSRPAPPFVETEESVGSATSSFDWELQSMVAALPRLSAGKEFAATRLSDSDGEDGLL